MAIQKLSFYVGTVLVLLSTVLLSCTAENEQTDQTRTTADTGSTISTAHSLTINSISTMDCFQDIHLTIADDVLLYWAEVATNTHRVQEHAGNERIVIKQDGTYYFSSNKGAIESFDNYFNTDLALYRSLSTSELHTIKQTLTDLELNQQPDFITDPDKAFTDGYVGYFYFNIDDQEVCKKIDQSAEVYEKIKALLRL